MTNLDTEVTRLARRMAVARLGLAQGGPVALLQAMIVPVAEQIAVVTDLLKVTEQPSFEAVDEPIGPATTRVLVDMVSPVPAAEDVCALGRVGCLFGMRLHNGTQCVTEEDLSAHR